MYKNSISICYTCRNRTNLPSKYGNLPLLKNSIDSVIKACIGAKVNFEIIISDWQSTDTDYQWVSNEVVLVMINQDKFSAGYGRNISAKNAKYDRLLFLDTDMLVDRGFIQRCIKIVSTGSVYFPHPWAVSEKDKDKSKSFLGKKKPWNNNLNKYTDHLKSGWCKGAGQCCLWKNQFKSVDGWPEYTSWGREDTHFIRKMRKQYKIVREKDDGLIHQWHPSSRSVWGILKSNKATP